MRRRGCPSHVRSMRKSGRRGGQVTGLKVFVGPPLPEVEAQTSAAVGSSFFKPPKRLSGTSTSRFDRAVMAKDLRFLL